MENTYNVSGVVRVVSPRLLDNPHSKVETLAYNLGTRDSAPFRIARCSKLHGRKIHILTHPTNGRDRLYPLGKDIARWEMITSLRTRSKL